MYRRYPAMTGVIVATPNEDAATISRGRGASPRCKAVQSEILCHVQSFPYQSGLID